MAYASSPGRKSSLLRPPRCALANTPGSSPRLPDRMICSTLAELEIGAVANGIRFITWPEILASAPPEVRFGKYPWQFPQVTRSDDLLDPCRTGDRGRCQWHTLHHLAGNPRFCAPRGALWQIPLAVPQGYQIG